MTSIRCLLLVVVVGCAVDGPTAGDGDLITLPVSCVSSATCAAEQHCSVEDGDCASAPGCQDGQVCPAVCAGICVSDGPRTCAPIAVAGDWSSPGNFERRYHFSADGSFVLEDLVAPCPIDAVCVWSGIIVNRGTWSEHDGRVTLAYAQPIVTFEGLRFAPSLSVVGCGERHLVEDGSGRVFNRRAR
jgi:hypothetical protein